MNDASRLYAIDTPLRVCHRVLGIGTVDHDEKFDRPLVTAVLRREIMLDLMTPPFL